MSNKNNKKVVSSNSQSDGIKRTKDMISLMQSMTFKDSRGNAFEDNISSTYDAVTKTIKDSVAVRDAYGNELTSIGTEDKVKSFTNYGYSNSTLNYPLWLALYNDSWVFRRAIDKPAQDIVTAGFTIHGKENDYSNVYKEFDKFKFDIIQLLQWGALFGGSIAIILVDGITDEELSRAIDSKKIRGKRMRLYVTDRWYGVAPSSETVTRMSDIDFGLPKYYDVYFADGKYIRVHHSWVLRYEHRTAPKLIKTGMLQGWGYAEGSHILNEISRDDQLKCSITSLINKSLIEVIKMSGMRGIFMGQDKGTEDLLYKRLEMVNWGRTYNSLTFLDKDDEYQIHELNGISGLSQLLETNMWLVAASLEMQGILFGDLRGGLSQESDAFKRYAVTIKNRAESYARPVYQKLLMFIYIKLGIEETPEFEFNSLVKNEENSEKMKSIGDFAQVITSLKEMDLISNYSGAIAMQNFINKGNVSIEFTEEFLQSLKYQEEQEILSRYSNLKKAQSTGTSGDILANQFPENDNNPFDAKGFGNINKKNVDFSSLDNNGFDEIESSGGNEMPSESQSNEPEMSSSESLE